MDDIHTKSKSNFYEFICIIVTKIYIFICLHVSIESFCTNTYQNLEKCSPVVKKEAFFKFH